MEIQDPFSRVVTEDPATQKVLRQAQTVAPCDTINILITGESGTGKNVLAKALHDGSKRKEGPYIHVNCLAIPDTLIESELFGHEKGAFTDAHATKRGSFELANGGSIYLDEIGDMTHSAQGKILQAIENSCFKRVGGERYEVFNARMIAATNRDLKKKVEREEFREDLYYRLKGTCLHLPPLRERKGDIPILIRHFVRYYGDMRGKIDLQISNTAVSYLSQYSWPGNIRELENVVKSAVVLCAGKMLILEHFPLDITVKPGLESGTEEDFSLDGILKRHILRTLERLQWNKRKVSQSLCISRPRLDRYIHKYGLIEENH